MRVCGAVSWDLCFGSRTLPSPLEVGQVVVAVERLGRLDVRVAEHPLNHAEVSGIATEFGRERVPGPMHVHPALNVLRDKAGPLQVLVPPAVDRLAGHRLFRVRADTRDRPSATPGRAGSRRGRARAGHAPRPRT